MNESGLRKLEKKLHGYTVWSGQRWKRTAPMLASTSKTKGLDGSGCRRISTVNNNQKRFLKAWMTKRMKMKEVSEDLVRAVRGATVALKPQINQLKHWQIPGSAGAV